MRTFKPKLRPDAWDKGEKAFEKAMEEGDADDLNQ
jgi:hypothetical protein